MLVIDGRMAVNGGRMVTTDASSCCCGDAVCDPSWVDATSCFILSSCDDPVTCTDGCTAVPGSVAILRSYVTSWNSGPILRKVELSNVALKLKQKTFPGVGTFYRWQGEATAQVTKNKGTFGETFPVPVCVVLTATLDGGIKWIITLESDPFTFTDAGGTTRVGQFGATGSQYLDAVTTENCGDCSGGLSGPITQPTGTGGSRFGAYCDAPTQGISTLSSWNGGWSLDLYGTLATDDECVGCSAVYAEFKPCNQTDTRVFWSKVNSCSIPPGTCTVVTDPGVCIASTGNTFPITTPVPSGVDVIDPICFNSETSLPERTCCSCRRPSCCDTRGGSTVAFDDACTIPSESPVTDLLCPCHASATATVSITGGGVYDGESFTITGSATGTKTSCAWTFTGSVTTSRGSSGGPQTITISTNSRGVPTWSIFPLGSPFEGDSTQSGDCSTHVVTGGFNSGILTGSMTQTTSYTYVDGTCGGMPCGCGDAPVIAGVDGAVSDLDSFFGSLA